MDGANDAGAAPAEVTQPRALIACVPNELHEMGPRVLADRLEDDGWEVDFCGSRVPLAEVIETIRRREPRFVGLSVALARHLDGARDTIAGIREALGTEAPPIVVGGNAFEGGADLWRQVGADLFVARESDPVESLRRFRE
jgi:MerR family transcriptional regulator, light-induced transcriptional regulator